MKLRDIVGTWTPSQWDAMVLKYVDERYLSGRPCPCPICGGTDRFTYDNKHGRGDWVCRKCNNGAPKAGDGLELIRLVTGKSFHELACEIEGGRVPEPRLACERPNRAGTASKTCDAKWKARRLASIRAAAVPVVRGDHGMAYLAGRVMDWMWRPRRRCIWRNSTSGTGSKLWDVTRRFWPSSPCPMADWQRCIARFSTVTVRARRPSSARKARYCRASGMRCRRCRSPAVL